jgi:hypothetical protein
LCGYEIRPEVFGEGVSKDGGDHPNQDQDEKSLEISDPKQKIKLKREITV